MVNLKLTKLDEAQAIFSSTFSISESATTTCRQMRISVCSQNMKKKVSLCMIKKKFKKKSLTKD